MTGQDTAYQRFTVERVEWVRMRLFRTTRRFRRERLLEEEGFRAETGRVNDRRRARVSQCCKCGTQTRRAINKKEQARASSDSALLLCLGSTRRASRGEAVELRCGEAGWEAGNKIESTTAKGPAKVDVGYSGSERIRLTSSRGGRRITVDGDCARDSRAGEWMVSRHLKIHGVVAWCAVMVDEVEAANEASREGGRRCEHKWTQTGGRRFCPL